MARSEADLLHIRNFGAKSIDGGLAPKDGPPAGASDAFGPDDDADARFVETEDS